MNMLPRTLGNLIGKLTTFVSLAWLVSMAACGGDVLDVDSYPSCSSYPCYQEIFWWEELWQKEEESSQRAPDDRPYGAAEELTWRMLRHLGNQTREFNELCRRRKCSSLEVAEHRQQVVYKVQLFVEHGIPLPPARGKPRALYAFMERWSEPLLLVALIFVGLLAACLRWGLLGAYAFAGAWHDLRRKVAKLLGDLRNPLPRPALWPALWAGLFLLAGWFMFISWHGWQAAWRLVSGEGP